MKNFREREINPGEPGYFPFDDESSCPAVAGNNYWSCTRTAGHAPPHAAHTFDGRQQATWEDDTMTENSELSGALSDLKKANEETATKRRVLTNRLDEIQSARKQIETGFATLHRVLSYLPDSVPDLVPEQSLEWHERLRAMEILVSVGKSSWISADHHLYNVVFELYRDVVQV